MKFHRPGRNKLTCLSACLPTHLSVCLPTCLSAYPPACLPPHLPVCLPTFLPAYPPACLPTHLPVCLPTCLPAYPPANKFIAYTHIYLFTHLPTIYTNPCICSYTHVPIHVPAITSMRPSTSIIHPMRFDAFGCCLYTYIYTYISFHIHPLSFARSISWRSHRRAQTQADTATGGHSHRRTQPQADTATCGHSNRRTSP